MTSAQDEEWISIRAFADREGVSVSTIRRAAKARLLTHRRRGRGMSRNAALEFPAKLARAQLWGMRGTHGIRDPRAADASEPGIFMVLQEIRDLAARFERLEATVMKAHSTARTQTKETERGE